MAKICTMGELMLRLATEKYMRFGQADSYFATYGGAEANVAVSLANYGDDAYFISKLPKHEIGEAAVRSLMGFGVHTDYIVRGGDRVGVYYLETGASLRPSKVIYDRAHSSMAEATAADFDFDKYFEGCDWFHFSGITPALSESAREFTFAAVKAAKAHGVTVSVDLNYRKKLWTPEQAKATMTALMPWCDVCIGNEEDAEKCLGFKPGETDVSGGSIDLGGYESIFRRMKETFGFRLVATTLRESYSASDNGWSALIYDGSEFYRTKKYDIRIVDRVGGGDAFSGGLIHALLHGRSYKDAAEFAVAASALKHTIPGDYNRFNEADVDSVLKNGTGGRVQR